MELTRRTKVLVWNDEIELSEEVVQETPNSPPSPQLSINSVPAPKRARRQSTGEFPPPIRRAATDAPGVPRPVPFARKFQRVHPGTTGVTVLEHLERLDAVEQSLSRLGSDETEEEVEVDVGESSLAKKPKASEPALSVMHGAASAPAAAGGTNNSSFSPAGNPPLATVPETESRRSSIDEEDLVALSKSTSHVEGTSHHSRHRTSLSTAGIEWISGETSTKGKVIAEVRSSLLRCRFLTNSLIALRNSQETPIVHLLVEVFMNI